MQLLLAPPIAFEGASPRWLEAERQTFEFGRAYDAYYTTESGWKRFWSRGHGGLICYRRLGKYARVVGGLLACDEEKPRLLCEFLRFCDTRGIVATFHNVTPEDVHLFRRHNLQITKWGEEPFVDLQECTWSGKQFEWVRRQTNYCRRAGVTIVEHQREASDDGEWASLIRRLRMVSDELLATKSHAGEIQLVEGQLEVPVWGRRRLFVAYSGGSEGRIEGFLIALPMLNGRQWAFEMYRHRPDAVRGVVPHLFHETMLRMKAEGVESVSVCLVPGLGCEQALPGDNKLTRLGLRFGRKYCNFLFDFAGLYHFKSRFRPRYESRYLCSMHGTGLSGAIAFFRMTGLLTFDWRKATRNLLKNRLKRRQRGQLADGLLRE